MTHQHLCVSNRENAWTVILEKQIVHEAQKSL